MASGREHQAEMEERTKEEKAYRRNVLAKRILMPVTKPEVSTDEKSLVQVGAPAQDTVGLASIFRQDLEGIRSLVTCTICNQLLYEPYTLACGHTYCYSCLCNWFTSVPTKTCPDCRERVRQMPASAFLVKQIVDTFVARSELMPSDESIEQHNQRKKEEADMVTTDKTSSSGLFKGCFSGRTVMGRTLHFDEEDGVMRCVICGHEYEGHSRCTVCHTDFQGDDEDIQERDDFSEDDMDDIDDSDMDSELAFGHDEDEAEAMDDDALGYQNRLPHGGLGAFLASERRNDRRPHGSFALGLQSHRRLSREGVTEADFNAYTAEQSDSEDEGSLADFVVPDDLRSGQIEVNSSDNDEDSDEGGAIQTSRRRNRGQHRVTIRSSPSVEASGTNGSTTPNSVMGRGFTHPGGWSPLQEDSDDEDDHHPRDTEDDESDSNTMIGNQDSDASLDSESEAPMSPNSRRSAALRRVLRGGGQRSHSTTHGYGYSAIDDESVIDDDGDVEMENSSNMSRGTSVESEGSRRGSIEYLGMGRNIIEVDDDSSDGSVRPPIRRRRILRPPRSSIADDHFERHFADYRATAPYAVARSPSPELEVFLREPVYGHRPLGHRPQSHHHRPSIRSNLAARFMPASERLDRYQGSTRGYHF